MDIDTVKVSSIVGLLADHAESRLEDLRQRYPKYSLVLQRGDILGAGQSESDEIDLWIDLAGEGLKTTRERIAPSIERIATRLTRAKMLRLCGNVVTLASSAGVVAAVLAGSASAAAITALINFTASSFTLFAGYLETPIHSKSGNLAKTFERLIALSTSLDQAEIELRVITEMKVKDRRRVMKTVKSANSIAAEVRAIERSLWGVNGQHLLKGSF